MKIRVVLISILLTGVFAIDAVACGDSLYRVGKGVSYRVYTAPLPGSVLVYGVRLVDNQMELTAELESGNYDVVIAPYSDHDSVEASAGNFETLQTTYLPVAMDKDEAKVAHQDYEKVMVADKDEIKHYLKAIHKSLKNKT